MSVPNESFEFVHMLSHTVYTIASQAHNYIINFIRYTIQYYLEKIRASWAKSA